MREDVQLPADTLGVQEPLSKKRIGAPPLKLYPFREFLVLVAGVFWLFGGSLVRSTGVLVARKAVSFINILLFF